MNVEPFYCKHAANNEPKSLYCCMTQCPECKREAKAVIEGGSDKHPAIDEYPRLYEISKRAEALVEAMRTTKIYSDDFLGLEKVGESVDALEAALGGKQ